MRRATALCLTSVVAMGAAAPLLPRIALADTQLCNQPSVSSLSQNHGPAGTTVTITGSGFSPGLCQLSVSVGANVVPSPSTDGSHISFTTATGWTGKVTVRLTDNGGASNKDDHFIYVTDPTFTGVDNATPVTGATVHLTGGGFDFGLPAGWEQSSAVYRWTTGPGGNCSGAPSGVPSVTDNAHIAVQMPSQYCDGAVDVYLSAPSSTANTAPGDPTRISFKFTAPFDIAANPASMSRTTAAAGDSVTVNGSGFGAQGGSVSVAGAAAPVQSWSDGGVTFAVPAAATSGSVTLTRAVDGRSFNAPQALTVNGAVGGVSPAQGAVGDTVTVTGGGFGSQAGSVSLAGTSATVQQWSPSAIVFTVPDGVPPGGTTIVITTNGTGAPTAPPFTVLPRITGTTPAHAAAGSVIEIDGTSFGTQQGAVQVGGQSATVTVWGDKSVVVQLPSALPEGTTTVSLTPAVGGAAATSAYSIDKAAPSGSGAGAGSGSGSSSGGNASPVAGTPGAQVAPNGLILPSSSGPIVAHGPVQFTKPSPPPGPVSLHLDAKASQADPGGDVPFTVALVAFGKPVVGAPVDLLLVIEPGTDATLNPAHAVTDAEGRVTGTIHLSKTPGDHIVLARSGIYSDEVRVVGRGANVTVASGRTGAVGGGASTPALVSVRSPVLWALVACILLFGAGFGLNLVTAPAYAGGGATGGQRSPREALLDAARAAGSAARYGASLLAVLGALALGALRRR